MKYFISEILYYKMIIYKLVNRILDIYKALVFSKDNHNYHRTYPLQYNNDGDRSFMSISNSDQNNYLYLRMNR